MAELDHRVKNILSNVGAISRLSSHRATSVAAFVDALDGRIRAMSRAHTLLRRGAWGRASLADLTSEALSPFRSRSGTNVQIDGSPVWIVPELTQSLALILHELATNAVKHGALSSSTGRVKVSWSRIEGHAPGLLRLVWQEEGGPAVSAAHGEGIRPDRSAGGGRRRQRRRNLRLPARRVSSTHCRDHSRCSRTPRHLPWIRIDATQRPRRSLLSLPRVKAAASSSSRTRPWSRCSCRKTWKSDGHHVVGPARCLEQGDLAGPQRGHRCRPGRCQPRARHQRPHRRPAVGAQHPVCVRDRLCRRNDASRAPAWGAAFEQALRPRRRATAGAEPRCPDLEAGRSAWRRSVEPPARAYRVDRARTDQVPPTSAQRDEQSSAPSIRH